MNRKVQFIGAAAIVCVLAAGVYLTKATGLQFSADSPGGSNLSQFLVMGYPQDNLTGDPNNVYRSVLKSTVDSTSGNVTTSVDQQFPQLNFPSLVYKNQPKLTYDLFGNPQSHYGEVKSIQFDQNGNIFAYYGDRLVKYDNSGKPLNSINFDASERFLYVSSSGDVMTRQDSNKVSFDEQRRAFSHQQLFNRYDNDLKFQNTITDTSFVYGPSGKIVLDAPQKIIYGTTPVGSNDIYSRAIGNGNLTYYSRCTQKVVTDNKYNDCGGIYLYDPNNLGFYPKDVSIDSKGNIYYLMSNQGGSYRIKKLDSTGKLVATIAPEPKADSFFSSGEKYTSPQILLDKNDNLYFLSMSSGNINVLSGKLNFTLYKYDSSAAFVSKSNLSISPQIAQKISTITKDYKESYDSFSYSLETDWIINNIAFDPKNEKIVFSLKGSKDIFFKMNTGAQIDSLYEPQEQNTFKLPDFDCSLDFTDYRAFSQEHSYYGYDISLRYPCINYGYDAKYSQSFYLEANRTTTVDPVTLSNVTEANGYKVPFVQSDGTTKQVILDIPLSGYSANLNNVYGPMARRDDGGNVYVFGYADKYSGNTLIRTFQLQKYLKDGTLAKSWVLNPMQSSWAENFTFTKDGNILVFYNGDSIATRLFSPDGVLLETATKNDYIKDAYVAGTYLDADGNTWIAFTKNEKKSGKYVGTNQIVKYDKNLVIVGKYSIGQIGRISAISFLGAPASSGQAAVATTTDKPAPAPASNPVQNIMTTITPNTSTTDKTNSTIVADVKVPDGTKVDSVIATSPKNPDKPITLKEQDGKYVAPVTTTTEAAASSSDSVVLSSNDTSQVKIEVVTEKNGQKDKTDTSQTIAAEEAAQALPQDQQIQNISTTSDTTSVPKQANLIKSVNVSVKRNTLSVKVNALQKGNITISVSNSNYSDRKINLSAKKISSKTFDIGLVKNLPRYFASNKIKMDQAKDNVVTIDIIITANGKTETRTITKTIKAKK